MIKILLGSLLVLTSMSFTGCNETDSSSAESTKSMKCASGKCGGAKKASKCAGAK